MPTEITEANQPLISIIVPVYCTEQYLEQCLLSIKVQDFIDFECLVVNDGSSGVELSAFGLNQDKSFKHKVNVTGIEGKQQCRYIFEKVVGEDKRFTLLEQENQGVSAARNAALARARGEWFINVDPDDWLLSGHLSSFLKGLKEAGTRDFPVVRFVLEKNYNTGKRVNIYVPARITIANTIHSCTFLNVSVLFNLGLVKEAGLKYDVKLGRGSRLQNRISNGGEDFLFAFQYLDAVRRLRGNFEIINISAESYMYREVEHQYKKIVDDDGPYRYALYFRQFGANHQDPKVRWVSWILPFWTKLKMTPNPFQKICGKVLSLILRLSTDCY